MLSDASVALTLQFRASAMLLSPIVGNEKVRGDLASNYVTSIPDFVNVGHLIQKLKGYGDVISLLFH
jgi:hypothetical protein